MEPGSYVPDFRTDGEGLSKLWSEAASSDDDSVQRRQSKVAQIDSAANEHPELDGLLRQKSSCMSRQRSGIGALARGKSAGGALMRRKSSGTGLLESGAIARAVVASADRNIDEGEATFTKGLGRTPSIRQALLLREASQCATEEDSTVFANDEEAVRLQDVSFTFAEMAALDMCAVRGGPVDVVALIHNAVRVEIECAVTMVCAMRRMGAELTVGDLMAFHEWWMVTLDIVSDYLDVEAKVILPWIRDVLADNGEMPISVETVLSRTPVGQTEVRRLAKAVTVAFERSIAGSPRAVGEAGRKRRERLTVDLVVAFDRFITRTITHMYDQECEQIVEAVTNSPQSYTDMVRKVVIHVTRYAKQGQVLLVLCGRWMKDPKAGKLFQRLLKENSDYSYNKLQSQYELNHGATVAVFKVKAGIR